MARPSQNRPEDPNQKRPRADSRANQPSPSRSRPLNRAVFAVKGHQQITTVGYRPVTKDVKSDAGDRVIPLGATTVAALRAYVAMRERWQQVCGDDWPDTGLFFVRPDGSPWHPQTITDRFDHLVDKSGLPPVRLHDLRHCAATYLRHG